MPVTFKVADVSPTKWRFQGKVRNTEDLFKRSYPQIFNNSMRITHSSFSPSSFDRNFFIASNHGFVKAVYLAYSHHYHLKVRPDDAWGAILVQLGFYINAHAEECRKFFVAHEGKKELIVKQGSCLDPENLAIQLAQRIENGIVDPDLRSWFMPSFATTTQIDRAVASVLMMDTMQKYFAYGGYLCCGIPTVTLLGNRADWVKIQNKIEKINKFGEEPRQFVDLLRPILRHLVACFDDPRGNQTKDFWGASVHGSGMSGPPIISGWVTAFCFWNEEGKCLKDAILDSRTKHLELDGRSYFPVELDDVPAGSASVPIVIKDGGLEYKREMVAGLIGVNFTDLETLDTIEPVPGWCMYEPIEDAIPESKEPTGDDL
ncbi:hypothetical protein BDV24DRAFT_150148 [Aspergillus arachidicola]|uniref:DUF4419 domain-containing protein n=1 Tax=Aspergillus arachidicola TaxID=656916 RepID=A0A2G7G478_9EURO|nr:hypothetical protein BDV24DRAFT_150148 [Aspergillus arachidicola]PIG87638.1 hypothetical protein AARAC_007233 [Aspergillus arachidicola]